MTALTLTAPELAALQRAGRAVLWRVVKPPIECPDHGTDCPDLALEQMADGTWTDGWTGYRVCPLGQPGEVRWCRETWQYEADSGGPSYEEVRDSPDHYGWRPPNRGLYYKADPANDNSGIRWRSPVTMPRWASRLTVRVESVDVRQRDGEWCWRVEVVDAPDPA